MRHQEVSHHIELVLSKLGLVLLPVVLVGSLELLQALLDGGGHRLAWTEGFYPGISFEQTYLRIIQVCG